MDRAKIVLLILSFFALLSCGEDSGQRVTLQSVVVSPASVSLQVQATQQFKATGNYTDGSSQDLTRSFTWTSSDRGNSEQCPRQPGFGQNGGIRYCPDHCGFRNRQGFGSGGGYFPGDNLDLANFRESDTHPNTAIQRYR